MKKIIAVLLTICLAFSLTACAANEAAPAGDTAPAGEEGAADNAPAPDVADVVEDFATEGETSFNAGELPPMKIALFYGQWESLLGMEYMKAFEYLAESFNFEPVFGAAAGGAPEDAVAAVETLLAGGDIDGIISISWDTARQAVADKYGVPVALACQFPSVEETAAVAGYETFLGGLVDDEVWAGYNVMQGLYNAGCRNIALSLLTPGLAQGHDDRAKGMLQFAEEHSDVTVLTESYTQGLFHEDVPTFVASFPELDGIAATSLGNAVYNALITEGVADGSVKVAGPDVDTMTRDQFTNGVQAWSCGGQYGTLMMAWAILYNYLLDGTRIIEDTSVPIPRSYLSMSTMEEFAAYEEIISSPIPVYSADELVQYLHFYNPEVTYADFVTAGEVYSLEDVLARREAAAAAAAE